jgi:uncharacterized Zn-binding protein involved in type VI secretion
MRRYTITLGATTTSGGRVVTATSSGSIHGVAIALEGDLVSCPVCKATGRILCVGPRIPETSDGKHVALENDLCTCRCTPSPKLLPIQNMRSQVLKDTGRALSHTGYPGAAPYYAARPVQKGRSYTDRFLLLDDETGAPLPNKEYAVVRADGKLEFGTSDGKGHTHLLSTTADAESVEIYV